MRKNIRHFTFVAASLALIFFVFGSIAIIAQTSFSGTWTSRVSTKSPEKIHLSMKRDTEKGKNTNGSDFTLSELGLTADQAHNGKADFRLSREAGTIDFDGTFTDGKGSGTFRFNASQQYIEAMRARGFTFKDDEILAAVFLNVTIAAADDLKSSNFGPLDTHDLFKAVIFKITPQFMAEMKATGYPDLSMEDLVKARIFKIDAQYLTEVQQMGYKTADFEELVKFRIFKVTPQFLSDVRDAGFASISAEDIVQLRIFNIDAAYIRNAKASDPNVTVRQLINMKIGVGRR